MYDAIVIGARCAGSPTAMLLARKGYKVLMLDRSSFPSDTVSTHIILPPGMLKLKQWGLADKVKATGPTRIRRVGFDLGAFTLIGSPPPIDGTSEVVSPRRTYLDNILVDAAIEAGVELRENCIFEDVLTENDRVTGIRYRTKDGVTLTEKAKIVIGADGRNSMLAHKVNAQEYNTKPKLTCWYYSYWSGLPLEDMIMYSRPNRAIGSVPTNDGLTCIISIAPAHEFLQLRNDIEGNYMKSIEMAFPLAQMVKQGKREERITGMTDVPNFFRKSFGPGWALVGDAAYHKDPITGQGISDSFTRAETLAEAIDLGFSGKENLESALARYERERDEEVMPMYEFTAEWASLAPPTPEQEFLFNALRDNQEATDRFIGTICGTVPIPEFFAPENIQKVLGVPVQ